MDWTYWGFLLAKMVIALTWALLMVPFLIWLERKLMADFQARIGPNRVGPFGLLQPIADGIKLLLKEDFIPAQADKYVHLLAPLAAIVPAMLAMSVMPFGPVTGEGTGYFVTHINVGLLFILGLGSLNVYAITLAGWASNNKYSLMGGIRSSAQMISYELAMGMALIPVLMIAGSLDLVHIVEKLGPAKGSGLARVVLTIPLTISFVIYCICGIAETNRAPFDLPEAESELVAGFHTEYSSMRFALFFLSEYVNMITVCAIATTLFLGGWKIPLLPETGIFPLLGFFIKVMLGIYVFMWLRFTFPRLRYDRLMKFGWTRLLPIALANIILTGILIVAFQ
jgi:NADH-quinone oxidoreductase subunit H